MQYRILDLGDQYKVSAAFGMRYALHFDSYTQEVCDLETQLTKTFGWPATTLSVLKNRSQIHHSSNHYRWYSGWKNLRLRNGTDWIMSFRTENERALAVLSI